MNIYTPWAALPHRVYYATEEERLYTDYKLWAAWAEAYNAGELDPEDDFNTWLLDAERYDLLRPIVACTVLWVETDRGEIPLFIDGYHSGEAATEEAEAWGWFYDDGFTGRSWPMSVINLDKCTDEARDWITDPANTYWADQWESYLYGPPEGPKQVLTVKPRN